MIKEIAIRYCDEYLARHISDIDKEFLEIAKEALQQEPCDKCVYSTSEGCQYDDITEAIPPVTPQLKTRWIPVSESLPEIHQDVLLSLRSLDVEVGFRGSTEPYYYCHGGYIDPQNVLAWQPLPEPYKAEGSGE